MRRHTLRNCKAEGLTPSLVAEGVRSTGENRQVLREPTIRLWLQGILRMRMLTHPHPFWATGGCCACVFP